MALDTNIVTALGAGSGVDIKALAKGLTDAERVPKQNAIQAKIDKSEAKISGYSAMMAVLESFKTAVDGLDSTTDFSALAVRNSNPSSVAVTTTSLAGPGSHSVRVLALAKGQRSISELGFDNITSAVNNNQAFNVTIKTGPAGSQTTTQIPISAGQTNATAVVNAINQAATGVSAQLVDTGATDGNRYRIVLTGQTGANNQFEISSDALDAPQMAFGDPSQQPQDASVMVNGLQITRSTNSISDAVPGLSLELLAESGFDASVQLSADPANVKSKLQALVQGYNDMVSDFKILSGKKSEDENDVFSGALNGDSTVRSVLSQVRQIFFGQSETKGESITNMRDMGVSVDKEGIVTLDESVLDKAISENFDEVVQALAGRQAVTQDGVFSQKRGIGATMAAKLREIMGPTGLIMNQSNSAETQVSRYETELAKLNDRMELILERYTRQFASMESLVGQLSAMRENLKGQFEAMAASYNQK
jgi:flagellar hook-associated protein 2